MNNMDFKEAAERYKKELLDMYKDSKTTNTYEEKTEKNENANNTDDIDVSDEKISFPLKINNADDPILKNLNDSNDIENVDDISNKNETEADTDKNDIDEETDEEDDDIENRYPPPVIPDFILRDNKEDKEAEEAFGYLKVRVMTGNGGLPVEGNSVIVSETVGGRENLIKILVTNSSGETEVLRLPTVKNPIGTAPDDYEMSSVYNVSVISEGFFSEVSRGVAIFDGITSVLNFLLIPEPFEYVAERPIVFENTEPDF